MGIVAIGLLSACNEEDIDAPESVVTPDAGSESSDPSVDGPVGFTYDEPGKLVSGSGVGREDTFLYAPEIRFPVEQAPVFVNSQVWGVGGLHGAAGSQCADANYAYPWSDNYCESRSWDMPLCPAGVGHQGVDIRPSTCEKDKHWVVAVEDGTITQVGAYSVYLRGEETGTTYRYLHLNRDKLASGIAFGQTVKQGQRIGLISDYFGGASTTIHLHFDMKQTVKLEDGQSVQAYVPPYASLVNAYQKMEGS